MKKIVAILLCLAALSGCDGFIRPDMIIMPEIKDNGTEKPEPKPEPEPEPESIVPFTPASVSDLGVAYVWDENVIPEITIHITGDEWNRLLARYDEFKGDEEDFADAREQLVLFIRNLNNREGEDLHSWLNQVFDMEFLLKTYAVNIAVGMWDGHWGNGNNFYLYFNATGLNNYKVFLLPYDYDNTLGTTAIMDDCGRQDPYNWGEAGILMEKILQFDDFRQMYREAFLELADPANDLFHMNASVPRIKVWQDRIKPYVSNDTGEDMNIRDRPASWSNHPEYRLVDTGSTNWFRVKTEVIRNMK